jgi:zinc/manganese transport system substrate-binding protein
MSVRLVLPVTAALIAASPAIAQDRLDVVASFSILGDMVERVGGDRVTVTTLVGADGDAHVYQPTPTDAKTILDADLVVVNGLGFEGFIDRLMEASGYKGPVITAAATVEPLAVEDDHGHDDHAAHSHAEEGHDHAAHSHAEEGHDHAGHSHAEEGHDHADEGHDHAADARAADAHAGHDHGPIDPHAWQDVGNAVRYVATIADGLCAADAASCETFRANAAAYTEDLKALDADIRARIAAVPEARRMVITSHDAFGYFGRAYDVRFVSPQGVSTDSEASARDVAALIDQIRDAGVKVIFVETISDPRLAARIAAETGAVVGPPLYSDALSAPGAAGDTYVGMMRHNADAMIAAMQQGS